MTQIMDEVSRPLTVVDELFLRTFAPGETPKAEWGECRHFLKALGLEDEERFARIPCINDVKTLDMLSPFTLVRYRGLVQDIFEPEIYASLVEERDESGQNPRVLTTKYRDCIEAAQGKVLKDVGNSGLAQRGACYCVPLPAETAWAKEAAVQWTTRGGGAVQELQQSAAETAPRAKRGRDADMDMNQEGPCAMPPPPAPAGEARRQRTAGSSSALVKTDGLRSADDFGLNFPIPEEEQRGKGSSVPCIIKLYDDNADAVRLGETVEFVGVLCLNPELATLGEDEQQRMFWDARNPSSSMVPRLHALFLRKLPHHHPMLPFSSAWLTEEKLAHVWKSKFSATGAIPELRSIALNGLAMFLGGDALAAQYVLMFLVSRSFGQHGDSLLGNFSMNIGCWPEGMDVKNLSQAIAEFVPRVAHHEVTAQTLNTGKWKPRKDFEANRLIAGRLQVASGTVVIFDETKMETGQLHDAGVRSAAAIRTLLAEHALACDFMSYDVKLQLEVQVMHVSAHRSIVPEQDVLLPLRPSAAASVTIPAAAMEAIRMFLALVTRSPKPINIPDEVTHKFSEDFCRIREQHAGIKSDLCHTWMNLARASCLTHGESNLTLARWQAVFELEVERLRRCSESNFLSTQ